MKKGTKYLIGGVAAVALSVFVGVGFNQVYAQEHVDEYPLIIQNLAEKFGVTEEDVQEVFKQTREQKIDERLDKLVEKGIITDEDKEKIKTKQDEVRLELESIRESDMSKEEKLEAVRAVKEEVKDWAESEGIDLNAVMWVMGRKSGRGMKKSPNLDQLVEDGIITEAQKDALISKKDEMRADFIEIKESDMSADEKREAMHELKEEFKDWAEDEGIDLPGLGREFGGLKDGSGMKSEKGVGLSPVYIE